VNAGAYTLTASGLYSNQNGYIISYADGVLTIDPAVLTAMVVAQDKVYDGNTLADATLTLAGFIGSETLEVSHDAAVFNSKDVASAGWVTVGNITLADGSNGGLASNYSLAPTQTTVAHIQPRALDVTGQVAADKVHDGTTDATLSGGSLGGVVAGDAVLLNESGVFATASVGRDISVTATNSLSGAASANYSLIQPVGLTASITAPPVTPVPTVPEVPQAPEVPNLPVTPPPPEEPAPGEPPPSPKPPPVGYERAVGHAVSTNASIPVSGGAASPGTAPPPMTSPVVNGPARYDLAGLNLTVEGQGLSLPLDVPAQAPFNEE